ncbi:poly(ADP-ribose) polymerase catalytic domain-containing protein [Phthorimaea operculella]|nr:poly(ADP-ribose) polymerase catalytic domain-containing protein [Phthorimaea operculella]
MYRVSYQVSAVVLDEVVGKLLRRPRRLWCGRKKVLQEAGLVAVDTTGGYVVFGPVWRPQDLPEGDTVLYGSVLSEVLQRFWESEEPPTADRRKPEDDECELFYQYNTARCPYSKEHYESYSNVVPRLIDHLVLDFKITLICFHCAKISFGIKQYYTGVGNLSVISDVPALDLLMQQLDDLDNLARISKILDLLFYVLVRLKDPSLKTIPPEQHESILSSAHSMHAAPKPQHIFQVVSSLKSTNEMKWKELAKNHNVFYAYHGNRLENFYTILNFGLQQHLNKTTVLGNGVYLSPELSVILPYSHGGFGWGASVVGGHLSCVAMCEVIDAPEGINCQRPVTNEGDAIQEKNKPMPEQGEGPMTPHYLVTNCDLVRVRYLIVYAKQPTSIRFSAPSNNRRGGIRQWLARHKLFSILFGYGLMLATIGLANNQPIHYYYRLLLKKFDIAYRASNM